MKITRILLVFLCAIYSLNAQNNLPKKKNVWVFVMAGQSNMAGRGIIEQEDTMSNARILTINKAMKIVPAKEPLHFYEPNLVGLDCGLSFGKMLLKRVPKKVSLLIIPTAVGGSAIEQWLGDSTYRKVQLLSNFKEKITNATKYGIIKGIIWHQGESNANTAQSISLHKRRLEDLFSIFRKITKKPNLPIVVGELGSYSKTNENWQKLNTQLHDFVAENKNMGIIYTQDLQHKGDFIHFNSTGQRLMGERYASKMLKLLNY